MTHDNLLPPLALAAVERVMEKGAQKDGRKAGDWREIKSLAIWFNKAHRHIHQWHRGEWCDIDSGEHCLAHAIADLMILLEHELMRGAGDG